MIKKDSGTPVSKINLTLFK